MTIEIPKLDYEKSLADASYGSAILRKAMYEPGFLFLRNIPGYDPRLLQQWTRWFFKDLTLEERMALRTNPYRGYVPADENATSSYKELYEIGGLDTSKEDEFMLYDKTPFPNKEPAFQAYIREYYSLMQEVALNLLRMLVPDEADWLDYFSSVPFSTLRLIHYPERKGPTPPSLVADGTPLHCASHTDNGFLTLLATFGQAGLEMRTADGGFAAVDAAEDGLFVNIGDLMASLLQGEGQATQHRVVDHGLERFSVPFFLEPAAGMPVTPAEGQTKSYGVFVLEKCTKFFEHAHLLDKVKADPRYRDLPEFKNAKHMA